MLTSHTVHLAVPKVNAIYAKYFSTNLPARACVAVSALPKGALFEIDCVAACE